MWDRSPFIGIPGPGARPDPAFCARKQRRPRYEDLDPRLAYNGRVVDPRVWRRYRRALAAIYLLLMRESPPDIDWPHARLRSVVGLYLLFPLLLLAGPIWLFGWIAAFVAPMQSTNKKDREIDL